MSSATKDLENDHVHILRLTDIMEKITKANAPDISDLETIVYLIRNYADGFHHAKEEKILFPFLSEKGFSRQQGPVAVMLSEHTQGRNYVQGMADSIILYKNGDLSALEQVFINMTGYVNLLRNHISKENNILFRMADKVLADEDHAALLNEYSAVIPVTHKGGGLTEYLEEIDLLEKNIINPRLMTPELTRCDNKKLRIALLTVMIVSFAVLPFFGREICCQSSPIPEKAVKNSTFMVHFRPGTGLEYRSQTIPAGV